MSSVSTQKNSNYITSIAIIGALFFIFGFVTWLNGTLIPFLKLACDLKTDTQAFLVTSAFYMAYFFLAIPSSSILQRTGFKNGMALGLLVMAIGSIVFIPAAMHVILACFLPVCLYKARVCPSCKPLRILTSASLARLKVRRNASASWGFATK